MNSLYVIYSQDFQNTSNSIESFFNEIISNKIHILKIMLLVFVICF